MRKADVSPKGLFDPYYVPKTLLHRDRELDNIGGIYSDSYNDDYGVNCLVHGITGVSSWNYWSAYDLTRGQHELSMVKLERKKRCRR